MHKNFLFPNDKNLYGMLVSLVLCCFFVGCSKTYTKPRSEVLSESRSSGIPLPSAEQEAELFFSADKAHQQRLMELVSMRANSSTRDANYRLGPGDEVEINVFDVPELNVSVKIRESGFVNLPLIGAVKAQGLTEAELQGELEQRLANFVRTPNVAVFVSNYGSQKVAVMGAVNRPGTYPLKKGDNSLVELLSRAGGVRDSAGSFVTFIPLELTGLAAGSSVADRARFSMESNLANKADNTGIEVPLNRILGTSGGIPLEIPIHGGDMLIVAEAGKVHVDGEVAKVGSYELGKRMTLLGALAASGGITYGAKVDEIEVVRDVGAGQKAHLIVDLQKIARGDQDDVLLRDGDVIVVPSDSSRRLRQDTYEGITRIINFGVGGSVNLVP